MGMYTDFHLHDVYVKTTSPPWVLKALKWMCGSREDYPDDWQGFKDHPLFETTRWKWMLPTDALVEGRRLSFTSSLKNYEDEIGKFLDWLEPHVGGVDFVGYYRYEEFVNPTLIYMERDRFVTVQATAMEEVY